MSLTLRTSTWNSPPSLRIRSVWPARTSRAGLASISLQRMRPSSQAFEASARVLKKRAAQSHLSMRTESVFCPSLTRSVLIAAAMMLVGNYGYEHDVTLQILLANNAEVNNPDAHRIACHHCGICIAEIDQRFAVRR